MSRSPKTINNKETFWHRLVKASEFANLPHTPRDIARELHVRPSAVSKYVAGKFPKKDRINQLAIKRGVRSEWLLSGQGNMVSEEALSTDTQEMLRIWKQLPDDAQERLLANMRYELQAAEALTTGKRQVLTEQLIKLLEKDFKPQ